MEKHMMKKTSAPMGITPLSQLRSNTMKQIERLGEERENPSAAMHNQKNKIYKD